MPTRGPHPAGWARGGALVITVAGIFGLDIRPEWLISVALALSGAGWAWLGYAL